MLEIKEVCALREYLYKYLYMFFTNFNAPT